MKRILATSALVALASLPLAAEQHTTAGTTTAPLTFSVDGAEYSASDMLGRAVYMTTGTGDNGLTTSDITDVPDNWERVAEIKDILIAEGGTVTAITLDVGGFLDLSDKTVRIGLDELSILPIGSGEGETSVFYSGDRKALETMTAHEEAASGEANYQATRDAIAAAQPGAFVVDGRKMHVVTETELTSEEISGVHAYAIGDERVGEVATLVLNDDGEISHAVIDVGGFIGLGEKPVAIPMDKISILREVDSSAHAVRIEMTQEQLNAMDAYSG